jgi:hypothetical protein
MCTLDAMSEGGMVDPHHRDQRRRVAAIRRGSPWPGRFCCNWLARPRGLPFARWAGRESWPRDPAFRAAWRPAPTPSALSR